MAVKIIKYIILVLLGCFVSAWIASFFPASDVIGIALVACWSFWLAGKLTKEI